MGRDSRQARRARERRQQEAQQRHGHVSGASPFDNKYSIIGGLAVVVAAVVLLAFFGIRNGNSGSANADAQATTTAIAETTPIAGLGVGPVQCTFNEMVSSGFYHVHSHLQILVAGKSLAVPPNIGFMTQHDCLYWVHTHSPSGGILHVESPFKIKPTLGDFFKIWGVPLSSQQVWKYRPSAGQTMKVWVNKRPYSGDPAGIILSSHELITIEIGPPFVKPASYAWGNL
ncbi:MAG: hypothetical protein NVS2B16_05730 [Chloroflexota bacterium]